MSSTDDPPSYACGRALLADPLRNRGTAFTHAERRGLGLAGLLPYAVETLDEQLERVHNNVMAAESDLDKHLLLRREQDRNETLFYAYLQRNLADTIPLIYTPTIGPACEHFSHLYGHPRGLFLAFPDRDDLDAILARVDRPIRAIVVTDGERILGLGDQGVGGMGIPVGKLSLYTACAGIAPEATLPVFLDVGTNNADLLADPLYLGWRHERIADADYFEFVDRFVAAVRDRFPDALLQWEDFAMRHATTLLERHRTRILSFNDDIQGTAAITVAALRGAAVASGVGLAHHRVLVVGAGSAGTGIARMVTEALRESGNSQASDSVLLVDNLGLLHDGRNDLTPYQEQLACPAALPSSWGVEGTPDLAEVMLNFRPTALIGVAGQPDLFVEPLIRAMATWTDRPIIFPLSNPSDRAEATPADVLEWTDGMAIVATGSPFTPVRVGGVTHDIAQANNVYVFPGLALGALSVAATRVTDAMLHAAAKAVSDVAALSELVLPPVSDIQAVSRAVAEATAVAAIDDGVSDAAIDDVHRLIDAATWEPVYGEQTT